jgi:hypothetical protein
LDRLFLDSQLPGVQKWTSWGWLSFAASRQIKNIDSMSNIEQSNPRIRRQTLTDLLYPKGNSALHASGMWMVLTYLLTTVHHVYSSTIIEPDGSIAGVFAGSWRAHGFLVFLVPVLLGLGALLAYRNSQNRGWLWGYGLIAFGVFTGLIGVWEGGWNHLAKLVFFALGSERSYAYGPSWLLQFPAVQPPTELFFEATGVLTLAFGLLNAWFLLRLRAALPRQREPQPWAPSCPQCDVRGGHLSP